MKVEVVYATPDEQVLVTLELQQSATVVDAIHASGLLERFPEIDLGRNPVGVFGKVRELQHPLRPGDRVEIYRPLIADPKESRRRRAAASGPQ